MKSVLYNNLSEKFKKTIRWGVAPERDEVIEFQVLNIPAVKQNGEMLPIYGNVRIPSVDTIYDPIAKEMVQIACIKRETGEEGNPYELEKIMFKRADKGVITITGKEPHKFAMLYYLRASNYNESNPLAVASSSGHIFKELEPVKSARQKLQEKMELNDCMTYINDLKEAEIISLLKALKQQVFASIEENKYALIEFVQKPADRERFNALSKDVRMPIAALITKAEELELIRYQKDPKIWIYVSTGKELTQVAPQTDNYEHLLDYFHNNKNGRAFKNFLEKEIEAIQAVKSKYDAAEDLEPVEKENTKKNGAEK